MQRCSFCVRTMRNGMGGGIRFKRLLPGKKWSPPCEERACDHENFIWGQVGSGRVRCIRGHVTSWRALSAVSVKRSFRL